MSIYNFARVRLIDSTNDYRGGGQFRSICIHRRHSSNTIRCPDSRRSVRQSSFLGADDSAVGSSIFLKERLSFVGKVACALCLVGASVIVVKYLLFWKGLTDSAPSQKAVSSIQEMQGFVISPGFLVFVEAMEKLMVVVRRSPHLNITVPRFLGWATIWQQGNRRCCNC